MNLSRVQIELIALYRSKREFMEEYDVMKMLRISKRKIDELCDKGELHRNVRGNRAYYTKYEVKDYALGTYVVRYN